MLLRQCFVNVNEIIEQHIIFYCVHFCSVLLVFSGYDFVSVCFGKSTDHNYFVIV